MQNVSRLLAAAALTVFGIVGAGAGQQPSRDGWLTYVDPYERFSFRYPSNLTVKSEDPEKLHIEGLVAVVNLVSRPESPVVLRLLATEPAGNRMAVSYDRAFLRKVCKSYEEIRIGPLSAVNCVTCGRAACSWTTHVLGRRQFSFLTGLPDEADSTGPRDGAFPLLSIVQSLQSF
jgi:hypothetical protein